jgi:hypothetical protein
LSAKSHDPIVVEGILLSQEKLSNIANDNIVFQAIFARLVIAFHFGNVRTALKMADASRSAKVPHAAFEHLRALYDALACLAAVRALPKRRVKLVRKIRRITMNNVGRRLEKMRTFTMAHPAYGMQVVHLIEAEMAALGGPLIKGNRKLAEEKYNLAIALAKKDNCLHIQALASERAALALQEFGDISASQMYHDHALKLYEEWGASAICARLKSP